MERERDPCMLLGGREVWREINDAFSCPERVTRAAC